MTESMRSGLFLEIVQMAVDTIRTQKMRSTLTILGILIGITSMVGMTSLVRGLDESLNETIQSIGPNTIFVMQFSGVSLTSGDDFFDMMQRPTLTPDDADAIARLAPSIASVNIVLGEGGPPTQSTLGYQGNYTKSISVLGSTESYLEMFSIDLAMGRFFSAGEVNHRRRVVVLGQSPSEALFPNVDPIGKTVRLGDQPYMVIGVMGPRPTPGGMGAGQDDFVVIPHTSYQKHFGIRVERIMRGRIQMVSVMIAAAPRTGVDRDDAMREVESVMRIRHGLRLDEANDFDLMTQEAANRMLDRISQALYLALVSISSIALLVGGIGVMAIMTISVKERTREIGTRKALGARRREILWQFLLEAVFLTAIGGALGLLLGSAVGIGVHFWTGFPISLPWWSFAIAIGFSATVGIVFGLYPAIRASGLDPIEALRYE